jgi:outer membrane lipoprotein-sorting protein
MNIQERLDIIKNGFPKKKDVEDSCYKEVNKYGTERWYNKDHRLHRDNDLPAVIYSDGGKEWFQNGELHRDNDLPAVIKSNGTQYWYQNGLRHRDNDRPAVIYSNGDQYWYQNGERIR